MSTANSRQFFLPAPIDGLNLIDPPNQLRPTEAVALESYYILDSGVYELSAPSTQATYATSTGTLYGFLDLTGGSHRLDCADNKIYVDGVNKTGALIITSNAWQIFQFNKTLFLFNGIDAALKYDIASSTLTAAGWSGVTDSTLITGTNYKSRVYAVKQNTAEIWYGGVSAITGAMTQFDVSQVLDLSSSILFITSWSYNQGLNNDELLVIVTTVGEVLVYAGDFPASSNFTLITRTRIPTPTGKNAWIKVGQDIYVCTSRGVLSLSLVMQGGGDKATYYAVSRKLGNSARFRDVKPALDPINPLIYFAGNLQGGNLATLWVLNYERGAWSSFAGWLGAAGPVVGSVAGLTASPTLSLIYASYGTTVYSLNALGTGTTPGISTPYHDFDYAGQKVIDNVRVLYSGSSRDSFPSVGTSVSVYCAFDFKGAADLAGPVTVPFNAIGQQKLFNFPIGGTGYAFSFTVTRPTSSGGNGGYQGMWIFYRPGGPYGN